MSPSLLVLKPSPSPALVSEREGGRVDGSDESWEKEVGRRREDGSDESWEEDGGRGRVVRKKGEGGRRECCWGTFLRFGKGAKGGRERTAWHGDGNVLHGRGKVYAGEYTPRFSCLADENGYIYVGDRYASSSISKLVAAIKMAHDCCFFGC